MEVSGLRDVSSDDHVDRMIAGQPGLGIEYVDVDGARHVGTRAGVRRASIVVDVGRSRGGVGRVAHPAGVAQR